MPPPSTAACPPGPGAKEAGACMQCREREAERQESQSNVKGSVCKCSLSVSCVCNGKKGMVGCHASNGWEGSTAGQIRFLSQNVTVGKGKGRLSLLFFVWGMKGLPSLFSLFTSPTLHKCVCVAGAGGGCKGRAAASAKIGCPMPKETDA